MDLNNPALTMMVTIICSVIASSGFWAFLQSRMTKNDATTRLLIGIAHDRVMSLGTYYIQRGYITPDEYENLRTYLYEPYREAGGNGTAKKIMEEVNKLTMKSGTQSDFKSEL